MEIKPIETVYNGYRFRSRLEARWAVFFDALGIKYEYEPEGYEVKGLEDKTIKYLPDFFFPEWDVYGEVKPTKAKLYEEQEKISWCIDYQTTPISKGLLILGQIPYYKQWCDEDSGGFILPKFAFFSWHKGVDSSMAIIVKSKYSNAQLMTDDRHNYLDTADAPNLPSIAPISEDLYYMSMGFVCWKEGFTWKMIDSDVREVSEILYSACIKARQARFEHGEKPQL